MQEDLDKTTGMEGLSIEEMFLKSQESYQEAQQRALEENKAFARTEFFRMDKIRSVSFAYPSARSQC